MQKSSKKSSKQSPSQAEEFVEELRADPTAGVQPTHAGPSSIHSMPGKAVKKPFKLAIPLGFGFKLTIEWRVFQILILAIGFYLWAAVTANDFLYLLAAGYFAALALGITLPLLQVLDIKAECSLPEQLIVSEWVNMRVKLSRIFILGPLSTFMPIRSLRSDRKSFSSNSRWERCRTHSRSRPTTCFISKRAQLADFADTKITTRHLFRRTSAT